MTNMGQSSPRLELPGSSTSLAGDILVLATNLARQGPEHLPESRRADEREGWSDRGIRFEQAQYPSLRRHS
jgi:hypothetical protein